MELLKTQKEMEEKVISIWSVLSAFEGEFFYTLKIRHIYADPPLGGCAQNPRLCASLKCCCMCPMAPISRASVSLSDSWCTWRLCLQALTRSSPSIRNTSSPSSSTRGKPKCCAKRSSTFSRCSPGRATWRWRSWASRKSCCPWWLDWRTTSRFWFVWLSRLLCAWCVCIPPTCTQ